MSRPQIQRLCYPTDKDGRITRRRLLKLAQGGFIRRRNMEVVNARDGNGIPVYHIDQKGRQFLSEQLRDDRLLVKTQELPQPGHLRHAIALTDTHILLDQAIAQQSEVKLCRWITEGEVVNSEESDRSKQFSLRTVFQERSPRVECRPDAAFMLEYKGHRGVFYVEQDRDRTFHRQVAQRKSRGYKLAVDQRIHKKQFPETTLDHFNVLFVTPTPERRDAIRRAFRGREADSIYMLTSMTELKLESFLHEPIFYRCDGDEAVRLIKKSVDESTRVSDTVNV